MPRLAPVSSRVRRGWFEFGIRTTLSWIHPHLVPRRAERCAAKLHAIMQAERPVVPELHAERHDAVAGPVWRARHGADRMFGGLQRDRFLEGKAAFQRTRLLARP